MTKYPSNDLQGHILMWSSSYATCRQVLSMLFLKHIIFTNIKQAIAKMDWIGWWWNCSLFHIKCVIKWFQLMILRQWCCH